jgi:hypothetical protein
MYISDCFNGTFEMCGIDQRFAPKPGRHCRFPGLEAFPSMICWAKRTNPDGMLRAPLPTGRPEGLPWSPPHLPRNEVNGVKPARQQSLVGAGRSAPSSGRRQDNELRGGARE